MNPRQHVAAIHQTQSVTETAPSSASSKANVNYDNDEEEAKYEPKKKSQKPFLLFFLRLLLHLRGALKCHHHHQRQQPKERKRKRSLRFFLKLLSVTSILLLIVILFFFSYFTTEELNLMTQDLLSMVHYKTIGLAFQFTKLQQGSTSLPPWFPLDFEYPFESYGQLMPTNTSWPCRGTSVGHVLEMNSFFSSTFSLSSHCTVQFPLLDLAHKAPEEMKQSFLSPLLLQRRFSLGNRDYFTKPHIFTASSPKTNNRRRHNNNHDYTASCLLTRTGFRLEEHEQEGEEQEESSFNNNQQQDEATTITVPEKMNDDRLVQFQFQWYNKTSRKETMSTVLGLFDGHGHGGYRVSHFAATELPYYFIKNLNQALSHKRKTTTNIQKQNTTASNSLLQNVLTNTILEIDATLPRSLAFVSGSTAILVYHEKSNDDVYIANTGDSTAFIVQFEMPSSLPQSIDTKKIQSNNNTTLPTARIIYQTVPHKPITPTERKRIEANGGTIWEPQDSTDSSRVMIPLNQEQGGDEIGLAMSRSIGDFEARSVGVIANPTVDIVSLRQNSKQNSNKKTISFVVLASDGLVDVVGPKHVAQHLVNAISMHYEQEEEEEDSKVKNNHFLVTACEQLIWSASEQWIHLIPSMGERYRDDISIAVQIL